MSSKNVMHLNVKKISSGIKQLDRILGGGIFIGDNVVWYDEIGSLAPVFCLNLMKASQEEKKPLIYLNFDRSMISLMKHIGILADNPLLTILDCFTYGKGEGAEIFLEFYEQKKSKRLCQVIRVDEPKNPDHVTGAFFGLHKTMQGNVRFVFDSLTGMQQLWGGENDIINFYSHSCPRLYELDTIAYWVVEKGAHSERLKANLNKTTQIAIDLSLKRGKASMTVLKAEKRDLGILDYPFYYWNKDINVIFDSEKRTAGRINLGGRLKELRTKKGLSQTELAKFVGVTPSNISQVESNQIYPSLPSLIKIAEILSVEVSSFLKELDIDNNGGVIFRDSEAIDVQLSDLPNGSIHAKLITPVDFEKKAEPYIIEIPPKANLPSHFFIYKGEEIGYLLSGELEVKLEKDIYTVQTGDLIYLTSQIPYQWKNTKTVPARLLWLKLK